MIVPIVRRTVTVRYRETFHHPFQCGQCQLQTTAHVYVEAKGTATTAYVRPDENAARQRAFHAAQTLAWNTFCQCPCPRCGGPGNALRAAMAQWQQRSVDRARSRSRVFLGGIALSFLWAVGCGAMVAVDPNTRGAASAVTAGFFFLALGAGLSGIVWAVMGPGKPPVMLTYIPRNVQFDPPPPGPYRAG